MAVGRNKDGTIYYSVRFKDVTGTNRRKKVENKSWKTLKEAKEAERIFLLESGEKSQITYAELYSLCLKAKRQQLKDRSIKAFRGTHELHILPYFNKKIVDKITRVDIYNWQKELLNKTYNKQLYSNRMLDLIQTYFKNVLTFGVQYGYTSSMPFIIPKVTRIEPRKEINIWTIEEFNKFISVIDDLKWQSVFTTLYYSGIRIGELIALNLSDYDGQSISISKTFDSHHMKITTPKTKNSYRVVALNRACTAMINELLITYPDDDDEDYQNNALFGFHTRLSTTTIERVKNMYCKRSGVKQIKIHEFRHSHVSLLISLGFQPIDIANRLGHTVTMVNEVYGHLFDTSQKNIIKALDDLT